MPREAEGKGKELGERWEKAGIRGQRAQDQRNYRLPERRLLDGKREGWAEEQRKNNRCRGEKIQKSHKGEIQALLAEQGSSPPSGALPGAKAQPRFTPGWTRGPSCPRGPGFLKLFRERRCW